MIAKQVRQCIFHISLQNCEMLVLLVSVVFSAFGGIWAGKNVPLLAAYFPALAYVHLGKGWIVFINWQSQLLSSAYHVFRPLSIVTNITSILAFSFLISDIGKRFMTSNFLHTYVNYTLIVPMHTFYLYTYSNSYNANTLNIQFEVSIKRRTISIYGLQYTRKCKYHHMYVILVTLLWYTRKFKLRGRDSAGVPPRRPGALGQNDDP